METNILNEIKEITAAMVVKKQDAAKLNFPKIIEIIKVAANKGDSECRITQSGMNEYDMKLLTTEGFRVTLVTAMKRAYDAMRQYNPENEKEWLIQW